MPWHTPQALAELDGIMNIFGAGPLDAETVGSAVAVLKKAEVTFVSGLLLHEFRAPKDKPSLRSGSLKHLGFFMRASADDLPKVLRNRAELAISFKLACF